MQAGITATTEKILRGSKMQVKSKTVRVGHAECHSIYVPGERKLTSIHCSAAVMVIEDQVRLNGKFCSVVKNFDKYTGILNSIAIYTCDNMLGTLSDDEFKYGKINMVLNPSGNISLGYRLGGIAETVMTYTAIKKIVDTLETML